MNKLKPSLETLEVQKNDIIFKDCYYYKCENRVVELSLYLDEVLNGYIWISGFEEKDDWVEQNATFVKTFTTSFRNTVFEYDVYRIKNASKNYPYEVLFNFYTENKVQWYSKKYLEIKMVKLKAGQLYQFLCNNKFTAFYHIFQGREEIGISSIDNNGNTQPLLNFDITPVRFNIFKKDGVVRLSSEDNMGNSYRGHWHVEIMKYDDCLAYTTIPLGILKSTQVPFSTLYNFDLNKIPSKLYYKTYFDITSELISIKKLFNIDDKKENIKFILEQDLKEKEKSFVRYDYRYKDEIKFIYLTKYTLEQKQKEAEYLFKLTPELIAEIKKKFAAHLFLRKNACLILRIDSKMNVKYVIGDI